MSSHFTVWPKIAAALLAASVLAGPAYAQSGLGTRLDEATQKLDSDMQNCRPVNLAEYAVLLNEAMANKQRATKAAKKGIPVNQAQVDADLAKASMLFARAQAAQAMQCMNSAQRQAQPQPQAQSTPQQTGMTPRSASPPPQGLTPGDEQAVARQQRTIDDFEDELKELEDAVKAGKCKEAWNIVDDLDEWLEYLDGETPLLKPAEFAPPKIPLSLIDQWDDRIDDLIENCPRPGHLNYKQVRLILETTNFERAKYGLDPVRWSFKLEEHAQGYSDQLRTTGVMSHASREGRGTERENLSQGLPGWSVRDHLNSWLKEKPKFKPGIFPDVSFTGNWYEVGHWTQWIWTNTRAIGCGMAAGGVASWFVCRYNPGGNRDGVPVGMPAKPQVAGANPSTADVPTRATELGNTASVYGSGYFYIPGQQAPNNTIRPRLVGGDYGYEPAGSVNIGATSDGGPIEYVRIVTLPQGNFNPYRYYSSPLISFAGIAAGATTAAQTQAAIDPVNSAFTQWAGNTLGQSSSIYGSDSMTAPSPTERKYGFDVSFGGGPDAAGNWQTGFHGFYSFGETPQTIYIDTKVLPPSIRDAEVFVPVKPNTPLEIM